MSRKIVIGLCAALAVFVFATMTVGQASGAWMRIAGHNAKSEAFVAIYGFPGQTLTNEFPVGGGLGRNFGFGQNMLFKAGGGIGAPLSFTLGNAEKTKSEACDSWIGGTLMSNNTGVNRPLSFGIEFADFQCNKVKNVNEGPATAAYADTQDQKWIAEICEPGAEECRVEPLNNVGTLGGKENVKIEHVAIDIGQPGTFTVVQGAVWGKWKNGAVGKPPCILLQNKPPAAPSDQNLMVTQTPSEALIPLGTVAFEVKGEACLFSANNDWVTQSEKTEPAIEITE